jgi:sigma-E factor negative regulatory protein RseB
MKRWSPWSLLLVLALPLSLTARAASDPEALNWLREMAQAMQQLSYRGRFVFAHDGRIDSLSLLHINDGDGIRERLRSLNGEAREVLRENENLTCVWPDSRQVIIDRFTAANSRRLSPIWVPKDLQRLQDHYRFAVEGRDRVADLSAVIISILPNDDLRYGLKLWIAEDSKLMLQSVLLDELGQKREQVMFVQLERLQPGDAALLSVLPRIDNGYALVQSHTGDNTARVAADPRWRLDGLPEGFRLEAAYRKQRADSDGFVQQMVLSDGMASVSVFIEPATEGALDGATSMGAVNAFGLKRGEVNITAIGEAPLETVQRIAEAVFREEG